MKKIILETVLKGPDGKEYENGQELGSLILFALNQKQNGQSVPEMHTCHSLRNRIFKGGEIEFTKEEKDILISQLHTAQGITRAAVFSAIEIFEG